MKKFFSRDARRTMEAFALLREQLKNERNVKTELLEALKRLADWAEQTRASGDAGFWDWSKGDEYMQARAAIAKAEGMNKATGEGEN